METALHQHRFLLAIKANFSGTDITDDVHIGKSMMASMNLTQPCCKLGIGICTVARAVCKSSGSVLSECGFSFLQFQAFSN